MKGKRVFLSSVLGDNSLDFSFLCEGCESKKCKIARDARACHPRVRKPLLCEHLWDVTQ